MHMSTLSSYTFDFVPLRLWSVHIQIADRLCKSGTVGLRFILSFSSFAVSRKFRSTFLGRPSQAFVVVDSAWVKIATLCLSTFAHMHRLYFWCVSHAAKAMDVDSDGYKTRGGKWVSW